MMLVQQKLKYLCSYYVKLAKEEKGQASMVDDLAEYPPLLREKDGDNIDVGHQNNMNQALLTCAQTTDSVHR